MAGSGFETIEFTTKKGGELPPFFVFGLETLRDLSEL
jgi:hypothetical protein